MSPDQPIKDPSFELGREQLMDLVESLNKENNRLRDELERERKEKEAVRGEVEEVKGKCKGLEEMVKRMEVGRDGEEAEQKRAKELAKYIN